MDAVSKDHEEQNEDKHADWYQHHWPEVQRQGVQQSCHEFVDTFANVA